MATEFTLEIVTVAVEETPPTTDVGFSETAVTVGPVTPSVAVTWVVPVVAVMVSEVLVPTPVVVTVKVAVVAPAATVTVVGGFADGPLEAKPTVRPPVGAGPLIVTVPVEEAPPRTEVGLTDTAVAIGALTVSVAVAGVPSDVAEMVTL